ncbi:MAG: hypothetical protein KIT43_10440 [Bauldia sp.]|nr:hypothetical protein [Bauldia sp.]
MPGTTPIVGGHGADNGFALTDPAAYPSAGGSMPYVALPDFDPYADGWNPGATGVVDIAPAIATLRTARDAIPANLLGGDALSQTYAGYAGLLRRYAGDAAQLDRIADEMERSGAYGFTDAANLVRNAIDAAGGGAYYAPSNWQPLYPGGRDRRGAGIPYLIGNRDDFAPYADLPIDLNGVLSPIYSLLAAPGITNSMSSTLLGLADGIENGALTVRDVHDFYLPALTAIARQLAPDSPDGYAANMIGGQLVSGIGRATGGAYTRTVFPTDATAGETFARYFADNLAPFDLVHQAGALALDAGGDATTEEMYQAGALLRQRMAAAHANAASGGSHLAALF